MNEYQVNAIKRALQDLNDAGYVHLDFKNNQFCFIGSGDDMKIGMIDMGGIVRVRGADSALAREIQSVVTAPYEEINQAFVKLGNSSWTPVRTLRAGMRKTLILEKYAEAFEDLNELGVNSIMDLKFNPSFGEQFSPATIEEFATAPGAVGGN